MKRKINIIILILIIIVIIIIGLIIKKNVDNSYIEKTIKNILNEKQEFVKMPLEYQNNLHYAKSNLPDRYDISDSINNLIDNIEISIKRNCLKEKVDYQIKELKSNDSILLIENDTRCMDRIANYITQNEIENCKQGKVKKELINILKKYIDYDTIAKTWSIINDKDKIVELPYGLYIKFQKSDKKNNNVNEIIEVKIIKDDIASTIFEVGYLDGKGEKKVKIVEIIKNRTKSEKNDLYSYYDLRGFNELYYNRTKISRLEICHHDVDAEREQMKKIQDEYFETKYKAMEEEMKLKDEKGELIKTKYYRLPYYNDLSKKHRILNIILSVYEYEKIIDIEFSATAYNSSKHKNITKRYILPEHPSSVDKAVDIYMSDPERVKADEEFILNELLDENFAS